MLPAVLLTDAVFLVAVLGLRRVAPQGWVKDLTAAMTVYVTVELTLHKVMEDGVAAALLHFNL